MKSLEDLTDAEVLSEVRYLKQTIAPNIREKRKIDKKFIKYSKEELIQQITNVLKPQAEDITNIDILLHNSLKETHTEPEPTDIDAEDVSETVGIFEGPLGESKVGVVLSKETIQLYQPTRYGFQPEDLTAESCKWKLVKKVADFDFITRRTGVYLRCSV